MEWGRIVMRDSGLFSNAQLISVPRAQEFVQAWVTNRELVAIGKGDERQLALEARTQVEEARPGSRRNRLIVLPLPILPSRSVTANRRSPRSPRGSTSTLSSRSTTKRLDGVAPQLENSRADARTLGEG